MSKSENTRLALLNAIDRILSGKPIRIDVNRGLSAIAVEEEANLGNGSAYYYKDIIDKIRELKSQASKHQQAKKGTELSRLRDKLANEKRLKEKYRNEIVTLKEQMSLMAATHNSLAIKNHQFVQKIRELENRLKLTESNM